MVRYISFDMDGTLIDSEFTDWVWGHGIPTLYAEKAGLTFEEAKAFVEEEYHKVGEGAIEWYDIKYWFRFFDLGSSWKSMMEFYADRIHVYPEVDQLLGRLKKRFHLILTSNAGREFIDVEMRVTDLARYFDRIFSATTDFRELKKTPNLYRRVCQDLGINPEDIVHVGDHYEFDYLVPQSLGIQAFYVDRLNHCRGEFVLRSLADLENRL
jgi:HAD superfamily hydrolase (TIGR01549 family)